MQTRFTDLVRCEHPLQQATMGGISSPELAGAWVNATANAGIAGGSAIGACLLQTAGLSALPWAGASLIGVGLAVVALSRKAFPARA